ncbi:MAG: hypothetical protein H0T48_02110 [Gemmatimonadaceae bacterium]|nr:hypothetical protein [Gemmatimonadaceae bacterium]
MAFSPSTGGLCKVMAASSSINNDSYGVATQRKFKEIKAALTAKYGATDREFDFLHAGSIWNEPRDWMLAVRQNERSLAAFWSKDKTLTHPLTEIALVVRADGWDTGYITVGYEFANSKSCLKEVAAQKNSNL